MYMWYSYLMDVPITQFRKDIFSLVNQALEGREVWFTHKGRRLKVVPEGKPVSKLSRITPMDILPAGVDIDDKSWDDKSWIEEIMLDWERNWDRQLAFLAEFDGADSISKPARVRKTRRKS
jgi:hypothetical protein